MYLNAFVVRVLVIHGNLYRATFKIVVVIAGIPRNVLFIERFQACRVRFPLLLICLTKSLGGAGRKLLRKCSVEDRQRACGGRHWFLYEVIAVRADGCEV